MRKWFDALIGEFGFECHKNFISSTFGVILHKKVVSFSFYLGAIGLLVKKWIGLEAAVFVAFLLLIAGEFFTGIKASIKEGNKIESKKFGRVILKMMIYTGIIGIINTFKNDLPVPSFFGYEVNIYEWIYFSVVNLILVQLIISVFENLSRLGYKETSRVFKVITIALDKWFHLEEKTDSSNNDTPKIS